jgi:hypothetical protein
MLTLLSPIMIALVVTGATIRSVDFKNFSFDWYPRWADTPSMGRNIVLRDGSMDTGFSYGKEPRKFYLMDAEPISYGDLTGDGNDEAVLAVGVITSGTARAGVVFVYTMSRGKPRRLLAVETGDRWDHGYHSASIRNGELIIERYKPTYLCIAGRNTTCRRRVLIFKTTTNGTARSFEKPNRNRAG